MTFSSRLAAAVLYTTLACADAPESAPTEDLRPATAFGDPLLGLTAAELARFQAGKAQFAHVETVAEGLGPVFNEASCVACHSGSAVGGGSTRFETRFGRTVNGKFDPMTTLGGSLIQDHGIGLFNGVNFVGEVVPAAATIVALRRTTPLFGLGLVDAVPDKELQDLAALERIFDPSVAGIAAMVPDISRNKLVVGRFGWKAQNPTLFQFSGDAYLNEMGVTSPEFPNESCPQGDCSLLSGNPVPGLNDDGGDVVAFTDFMSFLAPPPRGRISLGTLAGEAIFAAVGCATCHTPLLATGPSPVKALDHKLFHPFSDFLLHDMGSLGDGIEQGPATGRLMRTAPLWGARTLTRFLHDGRALSFEEAIRAHDGQGAKAQARFSALPAAERALLLAFLSSL
jgi:CxxC motif-containing protein (DUF1111 family)